jgi:type I restriction enzyme S subunit
MATDWPLLTIAECASEEPYSTQIGPFGKALTPEAYKPSGVPLLRGVNVNSGRFHDDDYVFISDEDADRLSKFESFPGDVLLVHKGTLGPIGLMPENRKYPRYIMGNSMMRVRCDRSKLLPDYLRYWLKSPAGQGYLLSRVSQVGVPQLQQPLTTLRKAVIPVPPLPVQEQIVGVLGALDDKIEQNRRTGRALEKLAWATFKAWFVDFEPVKAKAAGAAGFPGMPHAAFATLPDRLTDSKLGPVPQGWEVSNIGTVAQRIAMGPFGSDIKTDNFVSDGVPIIRGGNLTDGFVDRDFVFLTEAKADQLANANAFPGDIVITHRGTLGQIGLIPSKSRYKRYVVSQSQMLIRPNAAMLPSHFLYLFLTSSAGQHELLANRSQTGVPAISRPTTSVKAISLVLPQRPVVDAFEGFTSMLFNARVAAEDESHKLATLRDYLLPRLLSGQVRVRSSPVDDKATEDPS